MKLTQKERQGRGLDVLAAGLMAFVDVRMQQSVAGAPWLPLYEAKESERRGRAFRADLDDPRLLLRIVRFERGVFTEIDATQRAWIDELIQASNRAAHTISLEQAQVDRALDTMTLLARSLGFAEAATELVELRVLGTADENAVAAASADEGTAAGEPISAAALVDPTSTVQTAVRVPEMDGPRGTVVLSARVGDLDVVVLAHESLNYALVHNGASPVVRLAVHNRGEVVAEDVRVGVSLRLPDDVSRSAIAVPLSVHLGDVRPGQRVEAPHAALAWQLSPSAFLEIDESAVAVATLEVERGGVVHRDEVTVRVLSADEWWARSSADSLVSFVRPNEPAIAELLGEASALLQERTGSPSLQGYQAGPERAHRIARAVYDAMAARQITYVEPPASFEGTGQRIRSHREVLDGRIGTCLDLACTYAAALEQAGLAPVLSVTRNHAFCGYLTEDTQLPEALVEERGGIVTIADSESFEAIETTALTAGDSQRDFDAARAETRRWWTSRLDEVQALIDVRAAHRWYRPLPTIRREGDVRIVETVREIAVAQALRMPSGDTARTPSVAESAPARIARWRRSLLDMTYANPLLKLKAASTSTLHIPSAALGALEDLIAGGTSIELSPNDQVAAIHHLHGSRTAADVDADTLRSELQAGHRVFVAHTATEYATKLKALLRRAATAREETGTDSLYLALGSLRWTEQRKEGHAPLFLLPVRLVGGRGSTAFRIERDDTREMEPNYCLQEKLRVSFGLELPELVDPGTDDSGIDLDGAFRSIRSTLLRAKATSFYVEETAHLATFQFSTLGMWRDLDQSWEALVRRPAVRHIVETPGRPFDDGVETPANDDAAEATTYLPIPADGSQIKAVRWAAAGKSFILEGPPGTGKSQTITNLIAHCLAEGKKVLFVAEKQAALEVVQRRLDAVGLAPFSLDVHGANQTVSAVRSQLQNALESSAQGDASWSTLRSTYRSLVESLSHYPRHLHDEGPAGLSAWTARQIVLEVTELASDGVPQLTVPRSLVMGGQPLDDVYELAHDLGDALQGLGVAPADSPWRLAGPLAAGERLDRPAIENALASLRAAETALTGTPAVNWLAGLANTSAQALVLAEWLDAERAGVARGPREASTVVTPEWRRLAGDVLGGVEHCRATFGAQVTGFAPEVLERDIDALLARSIAADKKFFGKKKARAAVLAELQPFLASADSVELSRLTPVLQGLTAARHELARLVPYVRTLSGLDLPPSFNPFREADLTRLTGRVRGWEASAALGAALGASEDLDRATADVLTSGGPGGALLRGWAQAREALIATLRAEPADLAAWTRDSGWRGARERTAASWQADAVDGAFVQLERWVRSASALRRLRELGLEDLETRVLNGELRGPDIESSVRLAVSLEILAERLETTNLVGFDSAQHSGVVRRFVETGGDVRRRLVEELPARIVASRTFDAQQQRGDVGELRQQISRRRGGLTIRQLMQRYAPIITEVTPCFLMSPSSVARFLPADSVEFDVVVFDEASQIRVPEAIGAMGRGKAVVVVGDSQQMPPSSMFAASGSGGDDEEVLGDDELPVPVDMDSILSETVESNLPRLMLSWHYRSRDESLIAFSNEHSYEGRLASFPTPPREGGAPAVQLRRVDGAWEGGSARAARVNRAEAQAVVDEVARLLGDDPSRSIGVVTFNTQQRNLILDMLEQRADTDPVIAKALGQADEPLFVKNLENVQGDERDVVLFTLAFAKDAKGKVPLNWGPLTRAGGEKRLNVAVTRAKEQVVVFASFDPHELDLSSSRSIGLAHLKDYLLLARDGAQHALTRRAPVRDKHLQQVRERLEAAGLETRAGVGLSDFTIDLAVRSGLDAPWLAVLLDGPRWAARESAGDRDGLPRTVLTEQMGWADVARIWLPEWLRDADAVVQSIVTTAEGLSHDGNRLAPAIRTTGTSASDAPTAQASPGVQGDSRIGGSPHAPAAAVNALRASGSGSSALPPAALERAGLEAPLQLEPDHTEFLAAAVDVRHTRDVLDATTRRAALLITAEMMDVVNAEGPILVDRLARVTARRFELARVRGSRAEQMLRMLPGGVVVRSANGDLVAWPRALEPNSYAGYRVPGESRDASDVPYEELRNGMVAVVRGAFRIDEEELLRETARLFGWSRLGSNVRDRLAGVVVAAVTEGFLVHDGGRLRGAAGRL
ncbi:DUF4011 domain-containing protein [Cellulomonas cellasea]|uniref:DUF4011 domain-containing protein n=1 Tax=Cellulomonas cellasea TaxID=43670 RepID=UPI0025A35665|nr:DUF4011 domain-containing protein [Cellulomonas cellasea]MDM8084880.1 DUF4011 domain-containing protein [Cellulomonas cellasea]